MGVLTYAAPKTKNILSTLAKQAAKDQNEEYDKDEDSYRYMYENVSEDKEMGKKILDALDQVEAGNGPDATPGSEWSADGAFGCNSREGVVEGARPADICLFISARSDSPLGTHSRPRNPHALQNQAQRARDCPHHRRRVGIRLGRVGEVCREDELEGSVVDGCVSRATKLLRAHEADPLRRDACSGFNFDDEDYGYFEQEKSDIKVRASERDPSVTSLS